MAPGSLAPPHVRCCMGSRGGALAVSDQRSAPASAMPREDLRNRRPLSPCAGPLRFGTRCRLARAWARSLSPFWTAAPPDGFSGRRPWPRSGPGRRGRRGDAFDSRRVRRFFGRPGRRRRGARAAGVLRGGPHRLAARRCLILTPETIRPKACCGHRSGGRRSAHDIVICKAILSSQSRSTPSVSRPCGRA